VLSGLGQLAARRAAADPARLVNALLRAVSLCSHAYCSLCVKSWLRAGSRHTWSSGVRGRPGWLRWLSRGPGKPSPAASVVWPAWPSAASLAFSARRGVAVLLPFPSIISSFPWLRRFGIASRPAQKRLRIVAPTAGTLPEAGNPGVLVGKPTMPPELLFLELGATVFVFFSAIHLEERERGCARFGAVLGCRGSSGIESRGACRKKERR